MPNQRSFLDALWDSAPWMIPMLFLTWAGMIAFMMRCHPRDEPHPFRKMTSFRFFLMAGGGLGGLVSLFHLLDARFFTYLAAYSYGGVLLAAYVALIASDRIGAMNGFIVGAGVSVAFVAIYVGSLCIEEGMKVAVADETWQLPVIVASLLMVMSGMLGAKSGLRISWHDRPHWHYSDFANDRTTE